MKKWLLASAVAAVGMTSAANAAIIVTVTPAAVNPPQSSAGTMTGYTGYIVTLNNNTPANGGAGSGLKITGVDIFNGGGGFSGPIQQRWTFDADNEVFVPTGLGTANGANATTAANLDSHILIPDADRQGGNPATEDNNVGPGFAPDTAAADYGTGSFLKYAGGITNASSQVTIPLAYIIVKDGQQVTLTGSATEQSNGTPFPIAAVIGNVPEPTSMSLLGLGAMGLLARRRRMA